MGSIQLRMRCSGQLVQPDVIAAAHTDTERRMDLLQEQAHTGWHLHMGWMALVLLQHHRDDWLVEHRTPHIRSMVPQQQAHLEQQRQEVEDHTPP